MTHSKKYKPFMAYLTEAEIDRLRAYAVINNIPMTKVVREAIIMRTSGDNVFTEGFNRGIAKAVQVISESQMAQFRFPSGNSFADIAEEELSKHLMRGSEPSEEEIARVKSLIEKRKKDKERKEKNATSRLFKESM